jgi:hypothetical protein
MRRANALIVIAVLLAALMAACGDSETADQPPTSAQAQAQATTEEQTGSDAPAKQDQRAKEKKREGPDAVGRHSTVSGSPTCAEANQAADEEGDCRARHEAPPHQPSEAASSTKEDKPPPSVDPNAGHVGKEPGKPTLGAEQENPSSKDKPPPPVDPNTGSVGEEPGKPTLGAEQEHYSDAEIRCDMAAETPEEKDACYQ